MKETYKILPIPISPALEKFMVENKIPKMKSYSLKHKELKELYMILEDIRLLMWRKHHPDAMDLAEKRIREVQKTLLELMKPNGLLIEYDWDRDEFHECLVQRPEVDLAIYEAVARKNKILYFLMILNCITLVYFILHLIQYYFG